MKCKPSLCILYKIYFYNIYYSAGERQKYLFLAMADEYKKETMTRHIREKIYDVRELSKKGMHHFTCRIFVNKCSDVTTFLLLKVFQEIKLLPFPF